MTATLLRAARLVGGPDRPQDLLVADGVIRSLSVDDNADLARTPDLDEVHLDGRFVGPGLWDAHVHVGQWALAATRLDVSAARSAAEVGDIVRAHVLADQPASGTIVVGQGFRDGLWPDVPAPRLLDLSDLAEVGDIPVALVSGDVHTVWSNAALLRLMGLPETDWLLREQPAFDLSVRLSAPPVETLDAWVLETAAAAAARGVVGIVDFEFADAPAAWRRRFASGFRGLRVRTNVYPEHLDAAVAAGMRTDRAVDGTDGLLTGGQFKLFTDGALNTRTAWCSDPYPGIDGPEAHGLATHDPAVLLELARRGLDAGIVPTIHAIGDRAVTVALDTFEALAIPADAGERGSVQHVQLLHESDAPRFAQLGVRASVQPEHAMDDRDVTDHYWAGRTGRAYAFRTLLSAGATLELGSDAPVAPLDPWVAISAAVSRTRDGRSAWHPEHALTPMEALRASWGRVSGLAVAGPADLVITERDPLSASGDDLRAMPVWATMLAGRWTHRA